MNVYTHTFSWIQKALYDLYPNLLEKDFEKVVVEPTKEISHGDVATNAALVLSKILSTPPKAIAENLKSKLQESSHVESIDIAGPGFLNITFQLDYWHNQLKQMLKAGPDFGKPETAPDPNDKILVEYVSVNPTGPLHAGHGRNAILGDTIASLLSFYGYAVTREYYINDAGGQVTALAKSAYLRYLEAFGHEISANDFKDDMYGGDYLIPIGHLLKEHFNDQYVDQPESVWLDIFKDTCVDLMMENIRQTLRHAGIEMDSYISEKALAKAGLIDQMLEKLEESQDVYIGVLTPPKGIEVEDWEEKEQVLFKATRYGDDVDRVLKKSDQTWTYFAGDAAYHYDKFKRGYTKLINVFGADHAGYVKRLSAVVSALTKSKVSLEIKVTQMVNFMDNGVPVRMSKRAGTFITFQEVLDRVGVDATRYMMVSRHQDMALDFDFSHVIAQNKDNPIFYIQYAHARIHSVFRHAKTFGLNFKDLASQDVDFSLLKDMAERQMIKALALWPRAVGMAVRYREPHRIAHALHDLSTEFHSLWSKGKENTQLRFIDPNLMDLTKARLALLFQVATTIKIGLKILNINAIEEM